jgi:hypothetical protein
LFWSALGSLAAQTTLSSAIATANPAGLARLRLLSGDIEAAAQAWGAAGNRVEQARCLIAMGEWDAALQNLNVVLMNPASSPAEMTESRYLGALAGAFKAMSAAPLEALLNNPLYESYEASILYCLWKITGDERYQASLSSRRPESPEGRIIWGENVSDEPTPFWFLFPGRESLAFIQQVPGLETTAPSATADTAARAGTATVLLQTGLFGNERNAKALQEELQRAGFETHIQTRDRNGATYWAVLVHSASDINTTIIRLKDLGVESFPVYE